MESNRIRVAIDANVLINLFTLINPENDIDGQIIDNLRNKSLSADYWSNIPKSQWPEILKDDYLGMLNSTPSGSMIYGHLMDTYNMLDWIKQGAFEACITPTVLYEITEMNDLEKAFIRKYITIIKVDEQDADEVYGVIDKLATEYASQDAMKQEYSPKNRAMVPSRDAYIMAEASVCGLNLVTCDLKDYIHKDVKAKDFSRSDNIKRINDEFTEIDLHFISRTDKIIVPAPMSLDMFNMQMKKDRVYWYAQQSNISANNEIIF